MIVCIYGYKSKNVNRSFCESKAHFVAANRVCAHTHTHTEWEKNKHKKRGTCRQKQSQTFPHNGEDHNFSQTKVIIWWWDIGRKVVWNCLAEFPKGSKSHHLQVLLQERAYTRRHALYVRTRDNLIFRENKLNFIIKLFSSSLLSSACLSFKGYWYRETGFQ